MSADVGPNRKENTLPFVVAGTVFVRESEVPEHDGTVDGAYDLGEGDRFRVSGEYITPADSSLGTDKPGAFQRKENLLQVGLGERGPGGDVFYTLRADGFCM